MTALLQPRDLSETYRALRAPGIRVLAGGTDLYAAVPGATPAGPLVSIGDLPELRGIARSASGWRIGACTPWADIRDADLPPAFDALRAAAGTIGGRQIQNAGTIGGNLCNASPAADGVPPLLVLDAAVVLGAGRASRRMPLADFLTGARATALGAGEILTAVEIPAAAAGGRSVFLKLGARAHLVISIAMVAVRLDLAAGRVRRAALAIGACSAVARRLPGPEAALVGAPADAGLASRVVPEAVGAALTPIDDVRASAEYRRSAAVTLLRRAVAQLIPDGA